MMNNFFKFALPFISLGLACSVSAQTHQSVSYEEISQQSISSSLPDVAPPVTFDNVMNSPSTVGFTFGVDTEKNYAAVAKFTSNADNTDAVIPDEIEYEGKKYPVTQILSQAFIGASQLKTLTFGKNIKEVGAMSFAMCMNLSTVNLNEGLEYIYDQAFYMMVNKLTAIEFPSTLKEIGLEAFKGTGLTGEIILPESLEKIGGGAFMGKKITGFYFDNDDNSNANFKSVEGVLYSKDGTRLVCFPPGLVEAKTTLPSGIKVIDSYALYGNSVMTEVVLPASVEEIGEKAFGNCGLTSFNIPANVVKIGEGALYMDKKLTAITVDPANKTFKVEDDKYLVDINNKAIVAATYFTGEVVIPDGISSIAGYTFYQNAGLSALKATASLKSIGNYAFDKCPLTSVEFPGIESIGDFTFQNNSSLKELKLPNTLTTLGSCSFNANTGLTELELPSSLTTMGRANFYGCNGLKKAVIPGSIKSWADANFYQCSALEELTLGDGLTSIPVSTFNGCVSLNNVVIPATVKRIEEAAFQSCSKLADVTFNEGLEFVGRGCFEFAPLNAKPVLELPNSLETIDAFAFAVCVGLTDVKLGSGTKTIGDFGFQTQTLERITLNEGLQSLGFKALRAALTEVTIPSTVTAIGDSCFCKNRLKLITNLATTPQPLTGAITGKSYPTEPDWDSYEETVIRVPRQSVDAYKAANIWKLYKHIEGIDVSGIEGLEGDDENAVVVEIYTIDGRRLQRMQPGLNLCKMSNGKVKKVMHKE